jgi:hypothetical protein
MPAATARIKKTVPATSTVKLSTTEDDRQQGKDASKGAVIHNSGLWHSRNAGCSRRSVRSRSWMGRRPQRHVIRLSGQTFALTSSPGSSDGVSLN